VKARELVTSMPRSCPTCRWLTVSLRCQDSVKEEHRFSYILATDDPLHEISAAWGVEEQLPGYWPAPPWPQREPNGQVQPVHHLGGCVERRTLGGPRTSPSFRTVAASQCRQITERGSENSAVLSGLLQSHTLPRRGSCSGVLEAMSRSYAKTMALASWLPGQW
jgi:hypothetical protein